MWPGTGAAWNIRERRIVVIIYRKRWEMVVKGSRAGVENWLKMCSRSSVGRLERDMIWADRV
jgi:hypothetical protein